MKRKSSPKKSVNAACAQQIQKLNDACTELPVGCQSSMRRRVGGVRRAAESGRDMTRAIRGIGHEIDRLCSLRDARKSTSLDISYPDDLPISRARDEIAVAIKNHQVVVVCGETGSGKTTQLPKICIELGRGIDGMIGHTQPRRVAARSVASRVAEEIGSEVGDSVGYAVRFTDKTKPQTRLKMMTDGILLAETQRDRDLLAYDTIIIDEAHERSLNIDFLLGYLSRLLRRRPDLKVSITSATSDPEKCAEHLGGCPIIRVEGRSYPVEVRWRMIDPGLEDDAYVSSAVVEAVNELDRSDLAPDTPSGLPDVLVFLPGEREISEATKALTSRELRDTEVLPLYARLPAKRQDLVFSPKDKRRIVLATNVAETSLTVPRIRAVIDTGMARVSRYSARSRVQRLPIEEISQASAAQRAGRCGRVAPGVCIRLYEEEGFSARDEFTQPEIRRTNLASVILKMISLGLGKPEDFPFVERPSRRHVRDGYETLEELGAIDSSGSLTSIGRSLALLPLDPRLGRMILASIDEACVSEVLIIASALAVQDPRERPADRRGAADLAHAPFHSTGSDFLVYLRIWSAFARARSEKGSSQLKTWCRRTMLSQGRLREWLDVHRQLREVAIDVMRSGGASRPVIGEPQDDPPSGAIHRSILAGFISSVGRRNEEGEYDAPSGGEFQIFPGSVLRRERPPWIVCGEIVETTRKWGRTVGRIRGEWIERVAPHLVRTEWFEPHFLPETGQVAAWERVYFRSLTTTDRREVPFGPLDPAAAREVFIQEALVEEKARIDAPFMQHNSALREQVNDIADRGREQGLLVDEQARFDFFDRVIPPDVHSVPGFETWRSKAERRDPSILRMHESDLLRDPSSIPDLANYPDRMKFGGREFQLRYKHEPGDASDGVTLRIPIDALGALNSSRFEWLVPGLLAGKIEALIRSLPKQIRTRFMPISETSAGASEHLRQGRGSFLRSLAEYLQSAEGIPIPRNAFRLELLEDHHFMRFELVDHRGETIESTRDFDELLERHRDRARQAFEAVVENVDGQESDDVASKLVTIRERVDWDFDELPLDVQVIRGRAKMKGYPAVSDEGDSVRIRVHDDHETARVRHESGVRRLLSIQVHDALRHHFDFLGSLDGLAILHSPLGPRSALERGMADLTVRIASESVGQLSAIRNRETFLEFDDALRRGLWPALEQSESLIRPVLDWRQRITSLLSEPFPDTWQGIIADERRHVNELVPANFASTHPPEILGRLPTYLEAIERRISKLRGSGLRRDTVSRSELEGWIRIWADRSNQYQRLGRIDLRLHAFGWLIEEYRVSLFAQELGTALKVSPKSLKSTWEVLPD